MGFRTASAPKSVARAIVAVVTLVVGTSSAALAVSATLPNNAVIASAGQTTVVNLTVGALANLEAAAFNITFDQSIVTVPSDASVQLGSVVSTCNPPVVNRTVAGRLTVTLACLSPVSGSGTLLAITFQGVANGVSALNFTQNDDIPKGCQFNEGTPSCEPSNGMISVGPQVSTATATSTVVSTATATATIPSTATATATHTVPPQTATATGTATQTATATLTNTIGPSPTPTHTGTVTSTPSQTATSPPTNTPSQTATATETFTQAPTATITATGTATATATATPIPTPRITSGAVGGSTRVFGTGAANIAAPGIEIVAENGGVVLGTGGTNSNGSFTDGSTGIGLNRALIPGERIFARDAVNNLVGPIVTVGPNPPQAIPTMDQYGMAVLGGLLGLGLVWRLGTVRRRG